MCGQEGPFLRLRGTDPDLPPGRDNPDEFFPGFIDKYLIFMMLCPVDKVLTTAWENVYNKGRGNPGRSCRSY